ncbi:EAL domain-containing protein [Noviherbaspirillum sp. DKR-6]|uniref:EAL domain-containing protein n=2 Tax=Noviherbaspirillum pedocola TaxID=2801341 RepID=A0A934SZ63_9BURK|nr:EAL domain-containing protein [Noviherbaspirillum pedocola]
MSFAASLLVVIGLAATTARLADNAANASRLVVHTYALLDGLARVRASALDIELTSQYFRLSPDPALLAQRDAMFAERARLLAHISKLMQDNPTQLQRLRDLNAVVDERIAINRRIEVVRNGEGAEAAARYMQSTALQETRERMYRIIRELETEEYRLLSVRNAEQEAANRRTVAADVGAAILLALLLAANYLTIRRQQRKADSATRQVQQLLERQVEEHSAQLRLSQAYLEGVINSVPGLLAYIDAQQRYVFTNRNYVERFASGRADIIGLTVREVLDPELYARLAPVIARALSGDTVIYDWQPTPDSWELIHVVPQQDSAGRTLGYYVLGTEITERKRAEEQIRSLNEALTQRLDELQHVSRALRTLSAGNRSLLHARDEADLLDNMCQAIVSAGGYRMACVWYRGAEAGAMLQPMAQYGHPGGMEALLRIRDGGGGDPAAGHAVAQAIREGVPRIARRLHEDAAYAPWRKEVTLYGCCIANPLRLGGETIGALAIYSSNVDDFSDSESALLAESADDMAFGIVTFRERAEQERTRQLMHRLTWYDELTGLPNGNRFTRLIHENIERGESFALLQINVERLRDINEALGFVYGDDLLRQFGARLSNAAPAEATVARLRGDEFGILLPDGAGDEAQIFARNLERLLLQAFPIADLSIEVAAKIGIARYPEHGASSHALFQHMDIALNHARMHHLGYAVFDPSYSHAQAARLVMIGELRHAIENNGLRLYLQPKIDMRSGAVCGAEGLVRWMHEKRGIVGPNEFIALAEQTMLIKPLTEWVIDAALRLQQEWLHTRCAVPIAINLSAVNLRDAGLPEALRALRTERGSARGMLEIELTESMLMEDAEHALQVLAGLRDDGVPLHIDDFGTGYSSLSYLSRLPVDCIKIDRSFVNDMLHNENAARIVRSTIDLAHDLGCKVVAEGVESREHWDRLASFGCDIAQGFFIAKPMAAQDFPGWMEAFQAPQMPSGA